MDPSSGQHHHQEMSSQTLESMLACTKVAQQDHKKPRPQDEAAPNCPRCDSTNTKFCYYNNYSLSQPRYFCKSCRRYWTKGGTLRNVPVGGGCRKNNKRSSAKRSSQDSANNQISSYTQLPYDNPNDLTLAFARLQNQESVQLIDHISPEFQRTIRTEAIFNPEHVLGNRAICAPSAEVVPTTGLLDALRGGFLETPNGFFHHNNNLYYGSGGHNMGHVVENGDHMATHSDQEMRSGVKEEILWGYPWQMNMNGENGNMMSEFESSRQRLNGFGVPSWHGLVNSPLM